MIPAQMMVPAICIWAFNTYLYDDVRGVYDFVELSPNAFGLPLLKHFVPGSIGDSEIQGLFPFLSLLKPAAQEIK